MKPDKKITWLKPLSAQGGYTGINRMFFMAGVFFCIFAAADFPSGYARNLFTDCARKGDYIVSKTFYGFLAGAIFLIAVFIAIFLPVAVIGRQRSWLKILLPLFGGMRMFMMIPAMTPIDAGIVHMGLTLTGGATFAPCIGLISKLVLSRQDLV